jgi:hypothetical protein
MIEVGERRDTAFGLTSSPLGCTEEEEQEENALCLKHWCWKRILICLLLPLGFGLAIFFRPMLWNNSYFFLSMIGSVTLVIFLSFPLFSRWMHERPTYFEDLYDDQGRNYDERIRFQVLFQRLMNVPLVIFVACLAYYCLYQIQKSFLSYFEIVGIIGGALGVYRNLQGNVGALFLQCLHRRKNKLILKRRRASSLEEVFQQL